jgi:peptidoglycan hydrolase CwlO-like protein
LSRSEESPVTWRDILSLSDRITRLEESVKNINDEMAKLTSRIDRIGEKLEELRGEIKHHREELESSFRNGIKSSSESVESELKFLRSLLRKIVYVLIAALASAASTIIIILIQRAIA